MHEILTHALTVFMGFFAIMNPIANTPIFLSVTEDDDPTIQRAVARRAIMLTYVIIAVFVYAGNAVFKVFGISVEALSITGGIVILAIGYKMIQGEAARAQHPKKPGEPIKLDGELDKAVSPLAMPILAGPGTIVTAMSLSTGGTENRLTTVCVFAILCLLTYICFVNAERLVKYLGHQGMGVITRLMGLILAAIGVQMVIGAVTQLLKAGA